MNPVSINGRLCGQGAPVYLAFEIGGTMRDLPSALELLVAGALAGADGLKAQIIDADRLVGAPATYTWAQGQQAGDLRELLRARSLPRAEWIELGRACAKAGLGFLATVDFPHTLETAVLAGAGALKVCSGDVNHLAWIAEVARAGLPVMLDTGNATLGEVERAVDTIVAAGNEQVVIHHCPSGYPARLGAVNLRVIATLRAMFPEYVVGYSDRTLGRDMDVAAVALGAAMIEKDLTLEAGAPGPDHQVAVPVGEAPAFVRALRDLEQALGGARRQLGEAERRTKAVGRRSAFLVRDVAAGLPINEADIDWRRPGDGIEPTDAARLWGRRAAHNLSAGQKLTWADLA